MTSDVRYPIGRFDYRAPADAAERAVSIDRIAAAPALVARAVHGLTVAQLDTPYRPDGWTSRQVVHHLFDSHSNACIRVKLALTEDQPTIKPYDEARWAELPDYRGPIEGSLRLLHDLHERWVALLRALEPAGFARTFHHPEAGITFTVDRAVAMYAWHGEHHTAHVTRLRERQGW